MKLNKLRMISVLLTFSMLFSCFPLGIFAIETEEDPYILREDISKRTEDEKHFIMSDGSVMAAKYDSAIHYADEQGSWQEIDNSLFYDSVGKKYTNKNNPAFSVEFPQDGKVRFEGAGGYSISFATSVTKGLKNVSIASSAEKMVASTVQTEQNSSHGEKKYAKHPESFAVHNLGSELEYKEAYGDGTEVRYGITHNSIKEDIILEREVGVTSFVTEYYTDLTAIKHSDGSVSFVDRKGNEIFTVGAPYMYDGKGAECPEISVSVVSTKTGCRVVYTPDSSWLTSDEREYPITFDPNVSTYNYYYGANFDTNGYVRCKTQMTDTGDDLAVGYEFDSSYSSSNEWYRYYRTYFKPVKYPNIDLAFYDVTDIKISFKAESVSGSGSFEVYKLAANDSYTSYNFTSSTASLGTISFTPSTSVVEVPVDASDYMAYYNSGYDTAVFSGLSHGYIMMMSEKSSGINGTADTYIRFYGEDTYTLSKLPSLYVSYVAKELDGRYVFMENTGSVLCLNDDGTTTALTAKTGTNPNNPGGLTNPVKSIWKLSLLDSGVYTISPADDTSKYLRCNSSGTLSFTTDSTSSWAQFNIMVDSANGNMYFVNVQTGNYLAKGSSNALVDVGLNYSTNIWTVTDAYSIKGEISDKREYILYNPAVGKSLQFTNGTVNGVEFGEFNARTEVLAGTENEVDGEIYYTNCTVENSVKIQRIKLVQSTAANAGDNDYYILPYLNGEYSENRALTLSGTTLTVSSTPTSWTLTKQDSGKYIISSGSYKLGADSTGTSPAASTLTQNTLWNLDCIGLLVNKRGQEKYNTCGAATSTIILEYFGWTEDYNNDGEFDENDFIDYVVQRYGSWTYSSYVSCAWAFNELLCVGDEEDVFGFYGYEDPSCIFPETLKIQEYMIAVSTSLVYNCPIYTNINNPGVGGGRADENFVMEGAPNNSGGYDGHAIVLKGIYYNYLTKEYSVSISDCNWRYKDQGKSGVGYDGATGFDNVMGASTLLNYSIDYNGEVITFAGAKESIFDFGYTEQDI